MMLYHFCPAWMLNDILREGLTLGTLVCLDGEQRLIPHHQWLTSNMDWRQEWERHGSLPYRRNDYRLHVDIPESATNASLRKWESYRDEYPSTYKLLSAYGDPENWYVYVGDIPPGWIGLVIPNPMRGGSGRRARIIRG